MMPSSLSLDWQRFAEGFLYMALCSSSLNLALANQLLLQPQPQLLSTKREAAFEFGLLISGIAGIGGRHRLAAPRQRFRAAPRKVPRSQRRSTETP